MATLQHVAVEMAPGKNLRDMTDAAYTAAGVARHVVMTVPSFMCAAAVAAMTNFVATVPEPLYDAVGLTLRLRTIPAPIPPFSVPMKLCWHELWNRLPGPSHRLDIHDLVFSSVYDLPSQTMPRCRYSGAT